MRVVFDGKFDFVTLRAKNGMVRSMIGYDAGPDAVTVPREHGEAAVKAGVAREVKDPTTRPDKRDDRSPVASNVRAGASGSVDLTDAE